MPTASKVYIVTDLGYGDCGKGTTTDLLARQGNSLVVRHNGGPQAGHNVVTPDGRHHTFAQFGSGTFAGATTFLSRFMLVNPLNMQFEREHLDCLGVDTSKVFVDENAIVITPWHAYVNRFEEIRRAEHRHGSCGEGVGVAMQQNIDRPALTLRAKDLESSVTVTTKLFDLRDYLRTLLGENVEIPVTNELVQQYIDWYHQVNVVPSSELESLMHAHDQTIFEGAQGVLLDQDYGWHPHTTWSTCTHDNALQLIIDANFVDETENFTVDITRLGVVRAYTVRHGPGPHVTDGVRLYHGLDEPHNPDGPWQGEFRVGALDLVAHRYAARVCGGVDQVVVTHLDRLPDWLYCTEYTEMKNIPIPTRGDLDFQQRVGEDLMKVRPYLNKVDTQRLREIIEQELGPLAFVSYGPTHEDKKLLQLAV